MVQAEVKGGNTDYWTDRAGKGSRVAPWLNNALGDSRPMQEFSASSGWLWRFCQCHSIRQLSLQGGKLSADKAPADRFTPNFQAFVGEGGYSLHQVFFTVMRQVCTTNFSLRSRWLLIFKSLQMDARLRRSV